MFLVKMTSVQKALINAAITTVGNSKGNKEGIMHLLMASFRALPLDLMMPLSRRRIVLIFFFSYICPPFYFFLAPFQWLSQSARPLSSIVRLYTFAHAHITTFAKSKCQKKFGATFSWTHGGLITSQTLAAVNNAGVALGSGSGSGGGWRHNNFNPINQSSALLSTNWNAVFQAKRRRGAHAAPLIKIKMPDYSFDRCFSVSATCHSIFAHFYLLTIKLMIVEMFNIITFLCIKFISS